MKRSVIFALVTALAVVVAVPAMASAANGHGKSGVNGRGVASAKSKNAVAPPATSGAASAKALAKQARVTAKAARTQARMSAKSARTAPASVDASATTPTEVRGQGVANAMVHITANIEKALAKIAAGTKTQVPPGLMRVWLKFAGWLGIDPATMPGSPAPGSGDSTSTIVPTSTILPTFTVDPAPIDGPATTPAR